MSEYTVNVTQKVKVTLDETKFTDEFMQEFRESFYSLNTIEDHASNLAYLYATDQILNYLTEPFAEGYGELKDFGVTFEGLAHDVEFD